MKLSDLVHYRNQLDSLFPRHVMSALDVHYDPFLHAVEHQRPEMLLTASRCRDAIDNLKQQAQHCNSELLTELHTVREHINDLEGQYFEHSTQIFHGEFVHNKADYVLGRRLVLDAAARHYVESRLKIRSDWRYPGIIVNAGLEPHIESMVALDPLYVVDTDPELMEPIRQRFPDDYVKRLRFYTVSDQDPASDLAQLPAEQFGVICVYYFFNFRPLEIIKTWLEVLHSRLRPGGILMFTINDCDTSAGVRLAENNFMCYTPKSQILQIMRDLDFEVIQQQPLDSACVWLEARRTGVLSSIRGGQCLAKIIAD